MAQTQNDRHQ